MKVTFNWLKQYVDFDWSPAELAERLTMLGIEVEGIQKFGGEFEGIVVAQVLTVDKHPMRTNSHSAALAMERVSARLFAARTISKPVTRCR
jgi:hypothetical protein